MRKLSKPLIKALAEAHRFDWSIRNSHAIIHFRANIEFANDPNARKTLDDSMEVLRQCYHSDRRKPFHAMTFADLALRYWNAYRDDQAREYLKYANQWLTEQREKEPWLDVSRLLRLVQRNLQN